MAVILTVSLLFFYSLSPLFTSTTYAQTVTDTPTPTPTAIDNSATTTTAADTTSNTGSNSIGTTPTPTDTPTPTPDPSTITPTPTPTIDPSSITPTDTPTPTPDGTNISNTAGVSNDTQSNANTGNNTATDSATTNDLTPPTNDSSGQNSNNSSSSAPNSAINTGNATSTTSIVNQVNTNSINSNVINQTLNIFVAQSGSINLSDPFSIAADAISTHPLDSVINVSVTSVNNYAYITNDIASQALTGQNLISTADQSASITTGNAYSIVSLLNQVNFTVVNSQIHLITINIFGNLNGNIILPDANASTSCSGCGVDTASINNTAAVTNNLNSTADTGNNSIVASGSATISTGDAQSIVNNLNVVNTNVSGTNAEVLYINDLGNWNGNFIGWGNFDPTAGGASLVFYNFDPNTNGSSSAQTNINNTAFVQNNVSSLALSGGNSINGGNSSIATGNSFSAISLMNFINTNFINSFGFFGFINIFGNWNGNIGGASEFAALNTPNPDTTVNVSNDSSNNNGSSDTAQEQGGQLSVGNTNNVGLYVLPGDTVTFFLTVKNTGTGKVYSTTLNLTLIHNGQSLGTASFALGDIPGGKGVKVTTGIVLPKNTPPGYYTAVAESTGNVGPNNSSVSASSDSNFTVFGNTIVAAASYGNSNYPKTAVLGSTNIKELTTKTASEDAFYLTLIVLLTLAYVSIKIVRKREYIYEVISSPSFKEKLTSMRMLLL